MDQLDEKQLRKQIYRLFDAVKRQGHVLFTPFFDEGVSRFVQNIIEAAGFEGYSLFGGHSACARQMLGVFPDDQKPDHGLFPIVSFTATIKGDHAVSHRDVLGSLMALQLRRDSIGDIFLASRQCVVFVRQTVAGTLEREWKQIGGSGIFLERGFDEAICCLPRKKPMVGSVASLRLDAVVGLAGRMSRKEASELIRQGRVRKNGFVRRLPSAPVAFGDILSVQGSGKYEVSPSAHQTKKGRWMLEILKYV